MSGIAGFYHLDNRPAGEQDLSRMLTSIAHRGPDRAGKWCGGPVALGHRMLHTTPESVHEHLPLIADGGDLVLTCDARIDNRKELIAALALKTSDVVTDSDLILAAYRKWGDRCPEQLIGDFAFAIWDARRRVLFCARDPIGLKPFQYVHQPQRLFAFASEIRALHSLPGIHAKINEARVALYLTNTLANPKDTFYLDVLRLPPAHSMTITASSATIRRYWSLEGVQELRLRSDQAYAEAFRDCFMEAVRCRMRTTGPVGATLSGGLDSSTIVTTARKLLAGNDHPALHTFSAVWEKDEKADERPYIDAIINAGGLTPHRIVADSVNPFADIDRMLYYWEEPADNPISPVGWALRDLMRQQDIHVVLEGLGGDQTVSYRSIYLADLARRGRWITLHREISALAQQSFDSRKAKKFLLKHYVIRPLLPNFIVNSWRRLLRRHRPPRDYFTLPLQPDFIRRVGLNDRFEAARRLQDSIRTARRQYIHTFDVELSAAPLEGYDKLNAAFGFESRQPFLDRRVVELCMALPTQQRIANGANRVIVRRAMGDLLPESVRTRLTKCASSDSFAQALWNHGRNELDQVLRDRLKPIEHWVDVKTLPQIYDRFLTKPASRDAWALWAVVILSRWMTVYCQGSTSENGGIST